MGGGGDGSTLICNWEVTTLGPKEALRYQTLMQGIKCVRVHSIGHRLDSGFCFVLFCFFVFVFVCLFVCLFVFLKHNIWDI